MRTLTLSFMVSCAFFGLACSNQTPPPESPSESESPPPADTETAERPEMTREECESGSGEVIGDIGDGRIHQTSYVCPSGKPPTGNIKASAEGMPVEGAVCCN